MDLGEKPDEIRRREQSVREDRCPNVYLGHIQSP